MKNIIRSAALLAAFAAASAHAATFEFSYAFTDGPAITGSFSGDLIGAYVENISDIHVSFNGTEFSGAPLHAASWNVDTSDWDSAPARISTDAVHNNFIFADANVPADFGVTNYFYFINDPSRGQEVFATNLNSGDIALDNPANASWTLTQVPLPGAATLMLSGLGLLGTTLRRRRV